VSGAGWVKDARSAPLPEVASRLRLPFNNVGRLTCPSCGAEPKTRKCRWFPKAAPTGWTCTACDAKGSALDLVAYRQTGRKLARGGDAEAWADLRRWFADAGWCDPAEGASSRLPALRPLPKPAAAVRREDPIPLADAWAKLARFSRPDLAAAFWRARGLDAASAEAFAGLVPDLVHLPSAMPAGMDDDAKALWRLTVARNGAPRRPVLYLVRDANGEPRSAQRRVLPGPLPKGCPKSQALPADRLPPAFDGRPHLLGNALDAARALAAGERVALVEGEIDHACATAAGFVAIGATGADHLPRAAKAIEAAVRAIGHTLDLARMGLVVTVAHRGDTPTATHPEGAGGPRMSEAAELLRAAGIPTAAVVLPLRDDGRADLGDVAEGRCGPRALDPSMPALDALRAVFAGAALDAAPEGSWALNVAHARAEVLPRVLRLAGETAEAEGRPLVVVSTPPGSGKTFAGVRWASEQADGSPANVASKAAIEAAKAAGAALAAFGFMRAAKAAHKAALAAFGAAPESEAAQAAKVSTRKAAQAAGAAYKAAQAVADATAEAVARMAGRRVIYATRTHALAREARDLAIKAGILPEARLRHVLGLAADGEDGKPACRSLAEAEAAGAGADFRRALASLGRSVCNGCDYLDGCTVAERTKVEPGEVVFMPVAMLRHLPDPENCADLVILDDCGRGIETAEADAGALAHLHPRPGVDTQPGTAAHARATTPGALESSRLAVGITAAAEAAQAAFLARLDAREQAEREAKARGERMPPRAPDEEAGYRLTGAELVAALQPAETVAKAWASVPGEPNTARPKPPIRMLPGGAWANLDLVPDRTAWDALVVARKVLVGEDPPKDGARLALRLDATGWAFELRRPPSMPRKAALVALDGTAERTPTQWAYAAKANGRQLHNEAVRILAAPRVPFTWQTGKGLNVSRLGRRDGAGRFTFTEAAAGSLRAAVADAARRLVLRLAAEPEPEPADLPRCVGIVTHKPLAVALRLGLGLDVPDEDRATVTADAAGVAVGKVARDLRRILGNVAIEIGHFGADDRGTNRFDAVNALLVLGCPRPPLAPLRADAEAMAAAGIEAAPLELRAETIADTLAQAVARGRQLGNRRLWLTAGCADAPAPEGPELPGMVAEVSEANEGSGHAWPNLLNLVELLRLARTRGYLRAEDGPAEDVAEVAAAFGWSVYRPKTGTRGAPAQVWAATAEAARDAVSSKLNDSNDLPIYLGLSEGEHPAPKVPAPPSIQGAEQVNTQGPGIIEDAGNRAAEVAGELVAASIRDRRSCPTVAEVAEVAACDLMAAGIALAEVLRGAEAYAEAKGETWPPRGWSASPGPIPPQPAANEDAPPASPAAEDNTRKESSPPAPERPAPEPPWSGLPCPPAPPLDLARGRIAADAIMRAHGPDAVELAFRLGCGLTAADALMRDAFVRDREAAKAKAKAKATPPKWGATVRVGFAGRPGIRVV
jgi:hypothetical protein